jgi:hypothetical protein
MDAEEKKILLARKDAALDEIKHVLRSIYPECSEDIINDRVKFFWDELDFIVELNN